MPTRLSGGRVTTPEGCPENPQRERLEEEEEEEEEEEGLFKADAVNEEEEEEEEGLFKGGLWGLVDEPRV